MKLVNGYLKYPTNPEYFNCYLFTANRVVKNNGELVMGGGNALAFAKTYPDSPIVFGSIVTENPDTVFDVYSSPKHKGLLGLFVTKNHYKNPSCLVLVAKAVQELKYVALTNPNWTYHLPYPAIGLGGLRKEQINPLIEVLPDNVIVYE